LRQEERAFALVVFSMANLWSLIQSKQYQTAIEETSRLFQETQDGGFLYGRAIAYLLNKDYTAALQDCQLLIELEKTENEPDNSYLYAGVCYWYLNQPAKTVAIWKEALDLLETREARDVQPSTLLLYAAERLNIDLLREETLNVLRMHWHEYQERLKQLSSKKLIDSDIIHENIFPWPFPIVPLLLDEINSITLQKSIDTLAIFDSFKGRRQCQADFYLALGAFRKKENIGFRVYMTRCAENFYGWFEIEYLLASWEIENNFREIV